VRSAFVALSELRTALARERERIAKARTDQDYLRHAHEELAQLNARVGEENELASQRSHMQQAEKVTSELREAHDLMHGDHAPSILLLGVLRRLERRRQQAPDLIEPSSRALDRAIETLELAAQTLDQALRDAQFDPQELERIEERLFALRAAARKYNVPCDQLAALAAQFANDLAALDAGEAHVAQLTAQLQKAQKDYDAAALALSTARRQAAAQLDAYVNAELPPLKLERARFMSEISSDPAQISAEGIDRIEFWVQTNPGTRPGPLMSVASGGELARFMLALKVALADRGSAPTLVFDEIDTGVGGAVADAIGQRLARLARKVQVLAVTHAPQVAARAQGHFQIAKGDKNDKSSKSSKSDKSKAASADITTAVVMLNDAARGEEIARMLSGAKVTDEARAAARRLLQGAD
jgi:DNA repair protein RecN (Recombination protein N)